MECINEHEGMFINHVNEMMKKKIGSIELQEVRCYQDVYDRENTAIL